MVDLEKGKATICIINYKTPDFIRLCLCSIRKFTNYPYEVMVVDNDSQDRSLEYLKNLNWIRLIERDTSNDVSGGHSHASGLQLGLENCNTEFFISLHSDTFITRENWLNDLVSYFNDDENIACVGSGKVELEPKWRTVLKRATDFRTFKRKQIKAPDPLGKHRYYNRTICCLYRTEILRRENSSFLQDREKGLTAGKKLYFDLLDQGYNTVELPSSVMGRYIIHLAHATQVTNPEEFKLRRKTTKKTNRLTRRIMSSELIRDIMKDDSLDQWTQPSKLFVK